MNDNRFGAKCYSYEELNSDLLKEFSEGSIALENLLNYCYANKILTRACCKGHPEPHQRPYIVFLFNDEQKEVIETMINGLFNQSLISEHIYISMDMEDEIYKIAVNFDYKDETLREVFFTFIQKTLSSFLDKGVYRPGVYEGIADLLKNLNDDNIRKVIDIRHDGIMIRKTQTVNFYYDENGRLVETSVSENDDLTPNEIFIPVDNINEYILDFFSNGYHNKITN